MIDPSDGLKEKATLAIKTAAFKEGIRLTPTQESIAVNQLYETFKQMIKDGKASSSFSHATIRALLKTVINTYS